jgi:hypothetical protein
MKKLFRTLALLLVCSPLFAQTNVDDVLNQAQTISGIKNFANSTICILGSSTGCTTLTSGNASATNYTFTLPAANGTVALTAVTLPASATTGDIWYASGTNAMAALADVATGSCLQSGGVATAPIWSTCATGASLSTAQTWTALQTFTNSDIALLGSSTGKTTFTSANASSTSYTLTFPAVTDTVVTQNALNGTTQQSIFAVSLVFSQSFKNQVTNNILTTAQTSGVVIGTGWGTSPAISQNNGPSSFSVNVGTGGTASTGNVTLPAATHAWACSTADTGTTPTGQTEQTATGTTSITLTNYSRTTGLATAWTASEIIQVSCWAN